MDTTFTGQKSDDSTGLMFYNARYYDTTLGRFTQADTIVPNPMNPQSLNRYAYTLNNPTRYIDPTGHMFEEDDPPPSPSPSPNPTPTPNPNPSPTPSPTPTPAGDENQQGPDDDGGSSPSENPVPTPNGASASPTPDEIICGDGCTRAPEARFAPHPMTIMVGSEVGGDAWFAGGTICIICLLLDNKGEGALLFGSTSGGPAAGTGANVSGTIEVTNRGVDTSLRDKAADVGGSFYPGLGGGVDVVVGRHGLGGLSVNAGAGVKGSPVAVEGHGYFSGPTLATIRFSIPHYEGWGYSSGGGNTGFGP